MADANSAISIIVLNVTRLNNPIKEQRQIELEKYTSTIFKYILLIRDMLAIK